MIRVSLMLPLLLLAACGSSRDDVGGVSPDEDRQLNEAASALDANFLAAPDNAAAGNAAADPGNVQ